MPVDLTPAPWTPVPPTITSVPGFSSHPTRGAKFANLEPRANRVPASIAAAPRPADVAQAAAEFSYTGPNLRGLSITDAKRAQELVHDALATMPTPRIQVNRRLDNAEAILKSDASFPTMFDLPADKRPYDYNQRQRVEQAFNIFGRRGDAGKTVYGSVQFADAVRPSSSTAPVLNTGVNMYGPVSFVLKPDVWNRATVLPSDSYFLDPTKDQPGALENLADITTDRVARTFSMQGPAELDKLVKRPHRSAITQVKRALSDSKMTDNEGMIEASIRGVDRTDIAEIRVVRNPALGGLKELDRGIRRLRYHAQKLGIPVHQETVKP